MKKTEHVKKLYQKANSERNFVQGKLQRIARHTLPYTSVYEDATGAVNKKINDIDPVIIQSSKDLNNFIMSSMFSGSQWAEVQLDEDLFNDMVNDIPEINEKQYKELNTQLESDTSKVFKFINNSNYSSVVSKTMSECINLGTGCFKIQEKDSLIEPFTFQFIGISELLFTEDNFGKPEHVFRKYNSVCKQELKELFDIEPNANDPDTRDLIESVVFEDGIYHHRLSNTDFNEILFEEKLNYNPFIVYRFNTFYNNSYGMGIGFELIDEFERLKRYKELQRTSAELMVFPPLGFTGSVEYLHKINYGIGKVSYLGPSPDIANINPLNAAGNYLPLMDEINKSESLIRESYISSPIGSFTDRSTTTATEISARMSMFRERFSGTYELLTEELLKTSFVGIFKVMILRGILQFPYDYLDIVNLKYINKATKKGNQEKASEIINFKQIADSLFPNESQFSISSLEMLPKIAELMDMPESLFYDAKQIKERVEQHLNTQAQAQTAVQDAEQAQVSQEQEGEIR